jgi:hypothetical protein
MEQHNIDSRFKEGLGNIRRQPSADAWARLQSQMAAPEAMPAAVPEKEEEKHRPVFWLSIAAAIITLLVSVAVFRFGQNSKTTSPELAANQVKEKPAGTSNFEVKPDKLVERIEVLKPENKQIASVSTPKSIESTGKTEQIEKQPKSLNTSKIDPETASENRQLTNNSTPKAEKFSKPETNLNPEEKKKANETMLAVQTPTPKVEKITNPEADLMSQPIEVIVKRDVSANQVAMNEPERSEEKHSSFKFKNIVKQAVNLKQGEGVNLAELGLNENSKLAMDARNLRQKVSRVFEN